MRVLFQQRRIGDVPGNDSEVRAWRKVIQRADGSQKRRGGVNAAVGRAPGRVMCRSEIRTIKMGREANVCVRNERHGRFIAWGSKYWLPAAHRGDLRAPRSSRCIRPVVV